MGKYKNVNWVKFWANGEMGKYKNFLGQTFSAQIYVCPE